MYSFLQALYACSGETTNPPPPPAEHPPTFYLIGGQSNTGTNLSESKLYPTGRVPYAAMPVALRGAQANVKFHNTTAFYDYNHPSGESYGWINHLMADLRDQEGIVHFYKWGIGGTQLALGNSPYTSYSRAELKANGLTAWNEFKSNKPDARIIFLWCQGFTDGLDLQNSLDYGAHEVSHPDHATGGNLGAWFSEIRSHFGVADMKIVYNTLSNSAIASTYRANIKAGQEYVATLNPNNILVNADDLSYQADESHYDAQGVVGLSERYLTAINNLTP